MERRHFNKYEKLNFIIEWDKIVKLLKKSKCDLSKIKFRPEVN